MKFPTRAFVATRFADDPHLWARGLIDEVVGLGYDGSFVSFARQVRWRVAPAIRGLLGVKGRHYTYSPGGLRLTMTDGTGTTTYNYDDNNDLLSSAFVPAGGTGLIAGTTSYSYFSTGQRGTLTYPAAPPGGSATV